MRAVMGYHVPRAIAIEERPGYLMRIFGMGLPEIIIIVLIVCVLFGPALFKKINKQVKATSKAAKKGIESGAEAAGVDVDMDSINKSSVLDKVEGLQDRVDKMFADDDETDESASDKKPEDQD